MTSPSDQSTQKLPLRTLTAMVVGGMVGAGVFSIPRNFAQATGVYGAIIAWGIAGAGMLMLAFVFQTLANRKPDLDAPTSASRPRIATRCSFDDVLWVDNAKRDHFDFITKMRDRGIEVVEMHNLLAETVAVPEARKWIIDNKV